MEGTPLLRLFLPRPGFTRYLMQRSPLIKFGIKFGVALNFHRKKPPQDGRSVYLKRVTASIF